MPKTTSPFCSPQYSTEFHSMGSVDKNVAEPLGLLDPKHSDSSKELES